MYILGISTMTESAAVLMKDGALVAAAEEERFTRVKHDGGFPYHAIAFVLRAGGLSMRDVDICAVYWNPWGLGHRLRYMTETLIRSPLLFLRKLERAVHVLEGHGPRDSGWMSLFFTERNLRRRFDGAPKRTVFLDHHECHMASCFYASGFEEAAILIMDGAGEAACTTWASGRGARMSKLDEHRLPHSLGHYYSAVTGYLGFRMLDGEYKLMGLSPYGDASGARWIRENFLKTVGPGQYALETGALDYHGALKGDFRGSFADHFGPPRPQSETAEFTGRHQDIAASAQRAFEEVVLDMAAELRKRTGFSALGIAGGCGLNCMANGRILQKGIFESIYVPPVPNDSGGALGAAMLAYSRMTGARPDPVMHAQWGPGYARSEIEAALARFPGVAAEPLDDRVLLPKTAATLAAGGVVAWFNHRMEYGARALGNRSYLADPRSDGIRDVINEKIKKRELFRPFAPSVKAERARDYFEMEQESPFMTIITQVRAQKRDAIPAVTHVDGSARPQTVERSVNPRYWKLLDEFERLTGVPVLLNTSFNIQEPIVCSPADALSTFMASKVDALILENFWITRR